MSDNQDQPFQVMPDLGEEEYDRLKEDIRENGVEYPIIENADGEIIDGHHRLQAWKDLGRDPEEIPRRVVDKPEHENYHRAYRTNLLRRDLTDGTKRKVVKQYLLEHPERVEEDTQEAIASDLGVAQQTVSNAVQELRDGGKLTNLGSLSTNEKRRIVGDYVDQHPDASNRQVAREVDCDVTHVTVGNWRDEWGDNNDETTGMDLFTNTGKEAEEAKEVAKKAKESDDENVKEEAQKQAEKLSEGEQSVDKAADEVSKEVKEELSDSSEGDGNEDIEQFTSQETDEWSSPRHLVEPIDYAIGGFDLDPCSGAEDSPFAEDTYTEDDDGLSQDWFGSVWVNPPYSDMANWTEKAVNESKRDAVDTVVYLCKGDTSTQWWQDAAQSVEVVCAIDGRLSFGDGENSAPFASHILVFGEVTDELADELSNHGTLLTTGW